METWVQVPIARRWAIHFNVILVSARNGLAISTFFGAPLRRRPSSASDQVVNGARILDAEFAWHGG
ncbi:MAG TPA: hypothetical protein P5022_04405, partial [Candidatus Paceibacterota bacterium]|nr:hypothetical protein [Candidatus Paceibacterota bacterium]